MHKFMRLLRSVLLFTTILAVLTLWVLGTLITVQIDAERAHEGLEWEARLLNLTDIVDNHCRRKERKALLEEDLRRMIYPLKQQEILETQYQNEITTNSLHQNLIYVKDLEQMWCLVPKAASTSWSTVLIDILKQKYGKRFHEHNKTKLSPPLQTQLRSVYTISDPLVYNTALNSDLVKKILLVRHPFARIVSAYEDKLKNRTAKSDSMFFFRNFGVKINRQYRPQSDKKQQQKKLKKKEPTFEEFIEYLIQTDPTKYDEHWKPISLLCGVCQVKYDNIIRQEDLDESSSFHLNKLGFQNDYQMPYQNRMGTEKIINYFKDIPRRKMLQLFGKYKDDFIFNYTFYDYYTSSIH